MENYEFKDANKNNKINPIPRWISVLALIIVIAIYIFVKMPVLNPIYSTSFILLSFVIVGIVYLVTANLKLLGQVALGLGVVFLAITIYSLPIFHADDYYSLIGDVNEVDYEKNSPNIDTDKIPVVDQALAEKLGDKVLGDDIGLGSQYDVGEYYFVSTADDLAWVAPLEPRSFIKWFQNQEGSPGYVYVSATDPNDVKLVTDIDGNDLHIKYTNDSYFFSNVKRHAYLNKNMTHAMTDFSFEIDDNGNPYWIISTYKPTIGFIGYDTSGVIVMDAQSGETNYYDNVGEIPKWVERVQPTEIINSQVSYWGAYKNGWLNTKLAQKEMIKQTEGNSYVYIEGEPYYYTGLTSVKSDESTVGFMLVNVRTKESEFYKITGATEAAAQKSAEGQVQQYKYTASFPILLNEYNEPTYFMTLKDEDGLLKQYAFVSVENYNIVGVGSTIKEAQLNYFNSLNNNGKVDTENEIKEEKEGTVVRINYVDNKYYLMLEADDTIYQVKNDVAMELPLIEPGDKLTLEYIKNDTGYQTVTKLDANFTTKGE